MTDHHDPHTGLHSERGASAGEHPGRARDPIIKVHDLAWLEFEKPDLARAETFAHAFGFATSLSTPNELRLRGMDPGAPCVVIHRGLRSRFVGPAFRAAGTADLLRLAEAGGSKVVNLPESLGGSTVDLTDPSGLRVRVVADTHKLGALPVQAPHTELRARGGPRESDPATAPCAGEFSVSGMWWCRPPRTAGRSTGICGTWA